MLQRIDIYVNEADLERIFGLTMGASLSDEEVIKFHSDVRSILDDFKNKKSGKTSKTLLNEKQVFLINKETYLFCLLTDLDDKIKDFDNIIESLFTMLIVKDNQNKKEIDSDLKKTISDAINLKFGNRKKEKSLLKPSETGIKFPQIKVKLVGTDGNIFALMGRVSSALRQNRVGNDLINEFSKDVMNSSNYDEALGKITKWVNVY